MMSLADVGRAARALTALDVAILELDDLIEHARRREWRDRVTALRTERVKLVAAHDEITRLFH